MKSHQTLRNILVHPKDNGEPKEGVYTIDCKNCKKYVGVPNIKGENMQNNKLYI